MATNNITFPIYVNIDGVKTPFHDLVLRKATVDSVVMSLGDKITGDVYYENDSLVFTMQEYIEYLGVRYVLVNPPTIVREGMVSDNSDLKGMAKYSLVFYHPMYELGNMPFCDVAVTPDESKYLSESKIFNWIGKPADFVEKLNNNLVGTKWIVELGSGFPSVMLNEISEVLSFSNNFISDAIKTFYDQWEVPYIIDTVASTESSYAQGKRFKVIFGLPSQEIYDEGSATPYVFRFGQGVGLKNNSRTPKNNKIITRIAGCGSERNIPYGYPQVRWYGNQNWDYTEYEGTISYDASGHVTNQPKSTAYPLYMGIVGGEYVKLIKHPFTRKNLMPSVYYRTLFNKVSPYLQRTISPNETRPTYSAAFTSLLSQVQTHISSGASDIEVAAFTALYNALLYAVKQEVSDTYSKHIYGNGYDGSLEMSNSRLITGSLNWDNGQAGGGEFEFDDVYAAITGYTPVSLIDNTDYSPSTVLVDYYDAINDPTHTYPNPINQNAPSFETKEFEDVYPELGQNISIVSVVPINNDLTPAEGWDDTIDGDGNYLQRYFKITLPVLSFDIYACAAITEEMQINMRSGACLGCTFTVQVDWDDYKANFYDQFGNFAPTGSQRNYTKYPDSSQGRIDIILQKDNSTFGTIMPNIYKHPVSGDYFVVLGISLPQSYITSAEARLDEEMKSYMVKNNEYYFEYPLKFDEYFLENHQQILQDIKPNSIVRFNFEGDEKQLYVKQLVVKYDNSPLPKYDITLTDEIEVVINQIGKTAGDVEKLFSMYSYLRQNKDVGNDTKSIQQHIFKSLFSVYNDKEDYTDLFLLSGLPEDQSRISIKAKFGLWTDSFLSALGLNRTSGGGGGATSLDDLVDVEIASTPDDGQVLKYNEQTHKWVNAQDTRGMTINDMWNALATQYPPQVQKIIDLTHIPVLSSDKIPSLDAGKITSGEFGVDRIPNLDAAKVTTGIFSVSQIPDITISKITDFPSKWAWSDIDNKPTTLSGYGITDVTIADGVITLGTGNTITPVTSVAMTVPTGFVVTGSPITKTGTLALAYSAGYEGFTTTLKNKIDLLYSLFTREGSGTSADPYIIKANYGLYTEQFLSALGLNSQQGSSGALYSLFDVKPDDPTNPSKVYGAQTGYVLTYGSDGKWYAAQATGSVTSIIVGTTTYSPVNGVITLPAYPQVPAWAKAPTKPSYAFSEITGTASASQIPSLSWNKITTDKPTTISGYGISDLYFGTAGTDYIPLKVGDGNAVNLLTAHQTLYTISLFGGTTKIVDFKPDANASFYIKSSGDISLSADAANNAITLSYSHPTNGANTTITAANGLVLSAITVNDLGHVTNVLSKTLAAVDIPTLEISKINGLQTALDAKLDIVAFERLFNAMASDGTTKINHPYSGAVASIKAMFGLWTEQYLSALGLNSSQSSGGASTLDELLNVTITNPSDGQVLKYNDTTHQWINANDEGVTSIAWSNILNKPTTIGGYGITDAYINAGTIYIGGASITPLTSFIETDPTVPAWAKEASKPSYAFSEITGSATASQVPNIEDLDNFSTKVYDASATRVANTVLAAPNGSNGAASFRALVGDDLPTASASVKGGVKVGTGLAIASAVLGLATSGVTAGTYTKMTVDAYGRATYGTTLGTSDIPDLSGTYLSLTDGGTVSGVLRMNDDAYLNGQLNIKDSSVSNSYTRIQYDSLSDGLYITFDSSTNAQVYVEGGGHFTGDGYFEGSVVVDGSLDIGDVLYAKDAIRFYDINDALYGYGFIQQDNNGLYVSWSGTNDLVRKLSVNGAVDISGDVFLNDATFTQQYEIGSPDDPEYANLTIEDGIITLDESGKIQSSDEFYYFDNSGNAALSSLAVSGNVTIGGTLKIGDIYIAYDSTNNALKVYKLNSNSQEVAANFYALGGVSALGYSASGGGGGGASALSDLTDVQITNVANGQILRYDGTHWINITPNYATTTQLANYLPLSDGGVITGNSIQMTVSSSGLSWKIGNTSYGSIVFSMGNSGPVINLSSITKYNGYDIRNSSDTYFGTDGTDYIPITIGSTTKNVLTQHQSLSGYATQTWVQNQSYLTSLSLGGLSDVQMTPPFFNGQALVYNFSTNKWVNTSLSFLPLSGGTLTSTTSASPLTLQGNSTANSLLAFADSAGNTIGYLGMGVGVADNYPIYNNGSTSYKIWHSGNLTPSDYATTSQLGNYLPLSGGTLTGDLYLGAGIGIILDTDSSIVVDNTDSNLHINGYDAIRFKVNGTEYMTLLQSGNVGIGTTIISQYKLYVNGSLYAENVNVTGNVGLSAKTFGFIDTHLFFLYDDAEADDILDYPFIHNNNLIGTGNGLATVLVTQEQTCPLFISSDIYVCDPTQSSFSGHNLYVGGNVGIGTMNPSYKLHVNGQAMINQNVGIGTAPSSGYALDIDGTARASSFVNNSDIRKKSVLKYDIEPQFELVAGAPAIRFVWNSRGSLDNSGVCVGSIAQYWKTVIPEAVIEDTEGYLSMQYDVIALLSAISVAKRVTEHERRIEQLERENALLRMEINELKTS